MKDLGPRFFGVAWKVILIADLGVLLYGLMAIYSPEVLGEGFESYTDLSLNTFLLTNPKIGEYILLLGRLIGAFNVAFAIGAISIILMGYRKKEKWSWYALLIVNTVGYSSPILFDNTVGAIGIFEQLEIIFLLLIYLMLGLSAKEILKSDG